MAGPPNRSQARSTRSRKVRDRDTSNNDARAGSVDCPYLNRTALKIVFQPERYLRLLATLERDESRHWISRIAIRRLANNLCL